MQNNYTHAINSFWVIGLNYKKSDAAARGQYAVNNDQYAKLISQASEYNVDRFFIVSTCNRTEIYGFAPDSAHLANFLCSVCNGDMATFLDISYAKNGYNAIEHLYHVGAGLDSQILGDYEILGQVKNAVKLAKEGGFIDAFMERLVNSVIQASKAIKTHTALSGGTVSVSFAAIQYIREYFEGPSLTPKMQCPATGHMMTDSSTGATVACKVSDKKIVLLGTGKIGRNTCRNLIDYLDTHNITLINRTEETAANLAKELGLHSAPIEALESEVANADIILVSTNATDPLIVNKHLEGRGKKLVIDLSVPCNVAADAQKLEGVTFVDVDMLSKISDETLQKRRSEIPKALTIIEEHIDEFKDWYNMRKHVPVLKALKHKLQGIHVEATLLSSIGEGEADYEVDEEKIHKVISAMATKIRKNNTLGCHYIEAINEFIA